MLDFSRQSAPLPAGWSIGGETAPGATSHAPPSDARRQLNTHGVDPSRLCGLTPDAIAKVITHTRLDASEFDHSSLAGEQSGGVLRQLNQGMRDL